MLWNALRHPNILPLIGVIMAKTELMMVSEWMQNGNLNRFVREHQEVNRFELVSPPSKFLQSLYVGDKYTASAVERRSKGLDLHA